MFLKAIYSLTNFNWLPCSRGQTWTFSVLEYQKCWRWKVQGSTPVLAPCALHFHFAGELFKYQMYIRTNDAKYNCKVSFLVNHIPRALLLINPSLNSNSQFLTVSVFHVEVTLVFCYQNCSDLLWEKIVLVIEKNFWNSRLKAENLQKFWDH